MGTGTYFSQKFWPDSLLRQVDDELFAKKAWEGVADLRAEFRSFETFWSYCRGLQRGARRLGGTTVRDEKRLLGELLGIRRGNDVLLRKPKN
jgi:hypothetical protein